MNSALLLSGGMDSIALAFWLRPAHAITIDYGQKAAPGEIRAAAAVAAELGIEHHTVAADLSGLGSGDMAGSRALAIAPVPEWWPFRNQMLVTLAAMKALPLGVDELLIGCLKTDASHADGSRNFVSSMSTLLSLQEGGMRLRAPAINMTASELIRSSGATADILSWAHSCHVGEYACGLCRGCHKHYLTMADFGKSY
jgi:7-cyano-7-deazaguanine synthase